VLHQLCRWYNVEADFNNLPNTKLNADLSRTATLQDIISLINFTNSSAGIKIQLIDGRRLKISNN
jgi:transmembrane sensor